MVVILKLGPEESKVPWVYGRSRYRIENTFNSLGRSCVYDKLVKIPGFETLNIVDHCECNNHDFFLDTKGHIITIGDVNNDEILDLPSEKGTLKIINTDFLNIENKIISITCIDCKNIFGKIKEFYVCGLTQDGNVHAWKILPSGSISKKVLKNVAKVSKIFKNDSSNLGFMSSSMGYNYNFEANEDDRITLVTDMDKHIKDFIKNKNYKCFVYSDGSGYINNQHMTVHFNNIDKIAIKSINHAYLIDRCGNLRCIKSWSDKDITFSTLKFTEAYECDKIIIVSSTDGKYYVIDEKNFIKEL